jgi:hypothetical protein
MLQSFAMHLTDMSKHGKPHPNQLLLTLTKREREREREKGAEIIPPSWLLRGVGWFETEV